MASGLERQTHVLPDNKKPAVRLAHRRVQAGGETG
jgi:hypothetical protein